MVTPESIEEEPQEIPIFKNKHLLNDIVTKWQREQLGRPLRILETCQGIGLASERYRQFGPVIAFERNPDVFEEMRLRLSNSLKGNLLSLEECLDRFEEICNSYSGRFPVIVPSKPTYSTSTEGIHMLINNGLKFDVIDVDPYGSCKPFFPSVLNLLENKSLLLVTTGDMRRRFEGYERVMGDYGIPPSQFRWISKVFREDCVLYIGTWIIDRGLEKNMGLFPVYIHDYYFHPEGVQRACFLVCRELRFSTKKLLERDCIQKDPPLGKMIVCMSKMDLKQNSFSRKGKSDGSSAVRLIDRSGGTLEEKVKEEVRTTIIKRLEFLKNICW